MCVLRIYFWAWIKLCTNFIFWKKITILCPKNIFYKNNHNLVSKKYFLKK
jgi:hypothetical protein